MIGGMAGYQALAATGSSIVALLNRRFHEVPGAANVHAFLASTHEIKTMKTNTGQLIHQPAVSVYCYKICVDKETRPGQSGPRNADGVSRLPVRIHFLVAAWAPNATDELKWLGLAMQVLDSECILTGPLLDETGQWSDGDSIQIVADDLALDTMSEAFQALSTDFRLSLPYIARVVFIDGPLQPTSERVATVAGRLELVDA